MKKSSFIKAARAHARTLLPNSDLRIALEYLLANAVGRKNAITGLEFSHRMKALGIKIDKHALQNRLVVPSRRPGSDWCIASNHSGFFIIRTSKDAAELEAHYQWRRRAEARNHNNFRRVRAQHGLGE